MKKRFLLLPLVAVLIICALAYYNRQGSAPPDPDVAHGPEQNSDAGEDDLASDAAKMLIKECLEAAGHNGHIYFAGEEDGEPQEGDLRIDSVSYAGEAATYETMGAAFLVNCSSYGKWHHDDPLPVWRSYQGGSYVILGRDNGGEYYEARGMHIYDENADVEKIIREVTYGLMDIEVSLQRDGYPAPVGPGSEISFFRDVNDGPPRIEVLEGWEPVYLPGDYWSRRSWEGFTALCYNFGEGSEKDGGKTYSVYAIDTTRTDLRTYRGISVGSTREEVLAAYPEAYDTHYWNDTEPDFPGSDYLWCCDNDEGWGAAVLFFFEEDRVFQIRLNNMFD